MENQVILFPDYEKLKAEVEQLRIELSMLLLQRDELRLVECVNIETAYMLAIGSLEYKAYETECTYLRLKRKVEMIQTRMNRQEKVCIADIDQQLDNEFEAYQKALDEQIGKINAALERSSAECLTPEEVKEFKKLYRRIVKVLHPDLHPEQTEAKQRLFLNAVQAYKNGDLSALRMIAEMVDQSALSEDSGDAMSVLLKEKERLLNMLREIEQDMEDIKTEYPYTVKDLVENPEKMAARRTEIEQILRDYQEAIQIYQQRILEMTGVR